MEVKAIQQKALLEVRDIDQWSSKNDVAEELSRNVNLGNHKAEIISLRHTYSTQTALVLLPVDHTFNIAKKRHITIDLVSCRTRLSGNDRRCYHCLAFEHDPKACFGPNRRKCFRKCGTESNFAPNCVAQQTVI